MKHIKQYRHKFLDNCPRIPELITFAGTSDMVKTAVKAGADHILIEHPQFSTRSFLDLDSKEQVIDFTDKTVYNSIIKLVKLARSLNPNIKLSFNMDLLALPCQLKNTAKFKTLLTTLKQADIHTIRVQDPGLMLFLKHHDPDFEFHLAMETNNCNALSVSSYAQFFKRQVLSNEIPYNDLLEIRNQNPNTELEIQVFGPVLIQASYRRYLTELTKKKVSLASGVDLDHPDKTLTFYDNAHGHFTYAHFDKCLVDKSPQLLQLKLDAWLFDSRGQNETPRTLEPGFFLENPTDQTMEAIIKPKHKINKENMIEIGKVIDTCKGKCFTIELNDPFLEAYPKNQPLFHKSSSSNVNNHNCVSLSNPSLDKRLSIITPEQKCIQTDFSHAKDLEDKPVKWHQNHRYIKLPWKKGVVSGSRIVMPGISQQAKY
ncbi:peptidase U32 family protein [Thermoproteota archaeon]